MILLNDHIVDLNKRFPDGTFAFRISCPKLTAHTNSAMVRWHYESEDELAAIYYIVRHLRMHLGVEKVSLALPYVPNARMDRTHHDDEVFTLKYFADFINMLNFDSVLVLDPHSNVSVALIDRCKALSPEPCIRKAMEDINDPDLLMFYPDEGSMKRYSEMIKAPYAFGIKKRCWETGEITGYDVMHDMSIQDKNVLIVDDICCRGGTFFHAAKELKALGAKHVYAYCTHCEKSIFDGELLTTDFVDHVYTTGSIFNKTHEKITVLKEI